MERFRIWKIAVFALLAGGIIFLGTSRPVLWTRDRVIRMMAPLAQIARNAGLRLSAATDGLDARQVEELRAENRRLEADRFRMEGLARENQSLQKALEFRSDTRATLVGGRVLSYTSELGVESLVLDQGTAVGVRKGDFVVDENRFLIGEVSDASEESSRITIASNHKYVFTAKLLPGGIMVLARGLGARAFAIELIPPDTVIRRGDFLARGMEGVVGGSHTIAAGIIADEMPPAAGGFRVARATLLARPESLDVAFIILTPR